MQDYLKETTIIIPRINPLLQRRREPRVQMPEPHLTVKQAEDVVVVDVVRDRLDGRPGSVLEEPVGQGLERGLVHLMDLVHVLLADVAVEVDDEGLDGVGHEIRVVPEVRLRLRLGLPVRVVEVAGSLVVLVGGGHCRR